MTDARKIQMRGHCQCCCRIQAVTGGYVSKHGYEVKNRGAGGWFTGVCSGHQFAPVEFERKTLDNVVATVRRDCGEMRELADQYEQGIAHPATCRTTKYDAIKRESVHVAWDSAPDHLRSDEVKRQVFNLRRRAETGEQFAQQMVGIADEHHGQPLQEVAKDVGPAPILVGDKRKVPAGYVAQVGSVYGGMVRFTDGKGFPRKMSTRAWRALEAA